MITIFTYNRHDMLASLVNECKTQTHDILIIDDESDYDFSLLEGLATEWIKAMRFQHCGKEGFYKLWDFALSECEDSNYQSFMFMPDDWSHVDFAAIDRLQQTIELIRGKHTPYVCHITNDGRPPQWGAGAHRQFSDELEAVDWVDCGFFCNRAALDYIGYEMEVVPAARFKRPGISSGVGEQLTRRFRKAGVPMFRPYKALAYHGEHDSVMHPEERKINPLISKL